jgi:hypothetical protein
MANLIKGLLMADENNDILDFLDNLDEAEPASSSTSASPVSSSHASAPVEKPAVLPEGDFFPQLAKGVLDEEEYKSMLSGLAALRIVRNYMDLVDDAKKLLKRVNSGFWSLYSKLAVNLLKGGRIPEKEKLFFSFGVVDDKHTSPEVLKELQTASIANTTSMPVMSLWDWVVKMFTQEEYPSLTEMGIDFQKFLRERARTGSAKAREKINSESEEDKKIFAVDYEMKNMVQTVSRMMLPSRTSPYFFSDANLKNPLKVLITPEKVQEVVNEIRSYDFSLFYRETLFKISSTSNEIIHIEVEPYFILFPVMGDKVVFWQEFSTVKKTSRARFGIPVFFSGDFRLSMIRAFAKYRWEICRSIKGGLWSDPVEGGITGAFYDYITFFKKNPKLSLEVKEKLKELYRLNRRDAKRIFELYYMTWIEYERKGIMKLDKVARDIFFRYLPLSKSVRDTLTRLPAYERLLNRHTNISNRTIDRLNLRYNKKRDENGNLPPELQSNIDYYTK